MTPSCCTERALALAEKQYRLASISSVLRQIADELAHGRRVASGLTTGFRKAVKEAIARENPIAASQSEAVGTIRRIGDRIAGADFRNVRDSVERSASSIARVARKATGSRLAEKVAAKLNREQVELIKSVATKTESAVQGFWNSHLGPRAEAVVDLSFASAEQLELNVEAMVNDLMAGRIQAPAIPGTFRGTPKQYFRTVASVVQNRASNVGAVFAMDEAGVREYVIQATIDARTSEFCRFINGRRFLVSDGVQLARSYASQAVDTGFMDVETAQVLAGKSRKTRSEGLANAGLALPPYHHNCRTIVVPA